MKTKGVICSVHNSGGCHTIVMIVW
jgi:hypothetical protein